MGAESWRQGNKFRYSIILAGSKTGIAWVVDVMANTYPESLESTSGLGSNPSQPNVKERR